MTEVTIENQENKSKTRLYFLIAAVLIIGAAGLYWLGQGLFFESFETVEVSDSRLSLVQGLALKGQPAPEFELPAISKAKPLFRQGLALEISLPKVLVFWASWHQDSVDQLGILAKGSTLTEKGRTFEVVAVNLQENKKTFEEFLRKGSTFAEEGGTLTAVADETGEVGELYNVRTLPTTFFIDGKGIIQDIFVGVLNREMLEEKVKRLISSE